MAGDCQGQSVTTVSLVFALETTVQAYCVETPFHWWSQAIDLTTGNEVTMNSHGHAGTQGDVLPQPIDMVYTWYPPACANCTDMDAHNRDTMYFIADPIQSFMIAYTGMHEFKRDILPPFSNGNQWKLVVIGLVIGVVVALYACYFYVDFNRSNPGVLGRFLSRLALGGLGGVFATLMMYVWGEILYQVVFLHLVAVLAFTLSFVCSDWFNQYIGSPNTLSTTTASLSREVVDENRLSDFGIQDHNQSRQSQLQPVAFRSIRG